MKTSSLDNLRIAAPCPAGWDSMQGDDRVRHCELCDLQVYNLAAMTHREAAALVAKTEGRLCARLYRRADGTVITKDCPVGLRAIRRRAARMTAAAFAALITLATSVFGQKQDKKSCRKQVTVTHESTQTANGASALSGTILDPNGAVIARADITLTPPSGSKAITTRTNDEGKFLLAGLESGAYKLTVESPGFKKLELTEFKIGGNETVGVEAIMLVDVSSVTQGLLLITPSPIDTRPGTLIINQKMIQNLPIHED
jgi:hypothetical protein